MKTAIVTGANGFLGHHLVNWLSQNKYKVIAVVRDKKECVDNIIHIPNVQIIYCDMMHIEKLPKLITEQVEGTIFYHLAWAGSSGVARENYELQLKNVEASVKAAETAKQLLCKKIVYTGSVTQLMYRDYLLKDEITPERVTCYAVAKMATEGLIKCICTNLGIEYNWAYIANFYGADDLTNNFINMLIQSYSQGITPELTPATQLADFIYVTDVSRALWYMAEDGRANHSYYVGYGNPQPLSVYIRKVHQIINNKIPNGIGMKAFSGMDIDYESIDCKKLERDTGFIPEVCFEEGIERIISQRY